MSGQVSPSILLNIIYFPLEGRSQKPREQGLTMVIDKGMGPVQTADLLRTSGKYIDFLKLGFGTSALYTGKILDEKINLARSYGVDIYPGGTFLEIAVLQGKLKEYLAFVKQAGFTAVEVSDGTVSIPPEVREKAICTAAEMGLKVLTEVGKKDPRDKTGIDFYIGQIQSDLRNGAFRVIIEGRESGKNAGFYDREGRFIPGEAEKILSSVTDPRLLIWEAPLKEQQQELILRFGPDVNLGNVSPFDVLALEALRVGLRGDTLRKAYLATKPQDR